MLYVLVPIYIIVCVFLILVVLLQQGKGADIASAFGASSSQTTFGARGATTLLEKVTTWSFVAFSLLAVAISMIQATPKGSVVAKEAKKAPAAAPAPAAAAPVTPATGIAAPATPSGATTAAEAPPATAPATTVTEPVPATAAPSGVPATK
jgi:preprotein translocase subunit SecG